MWLLLKVSIIVVVIVTGLAAYLGWAGHELLPQLLSALQGLDVNLLVLSLDPIFLVAMVFMLAREEARREAQAGDE